MELQTCRLLHSPSPLWAGVAPKAPGWGKLQNAGPIMPHSDIARRTRSQAQSLRRSPTDAERRMWWILRSLKPMGVHFRRLAPIDSFIVDFAWYAGKLVVEIDGGQHAEARRAYDERRTA